MKKIMLAIVLVFTVGLVQAQTDSVRLQFDYYPEANVYYNNKAKTYWYIDPATKKWKSDATLPASFSVNEKSSKTRLFYDGPEVWKNNEKHVKMFGKKPKS